MKRGIKIILVLVVVLLVLIGATTILSKAGIDTPISGMTDNVTNSIANGIIDAADIKGKAQSALEDNATAISNATGIPVSAVDAMIDDLGIQDWTVTSVPSGAVVTDTSSIAYGGENISVKSYDDPSIVTLGYKGAELTFEIPQSAQGYVKYLELLP